MKFVVEKGKPPGTMTTTTEKKKDPLEGMTLERILTILVEAYGWEELGREIRINCFNFDPSIKSSLHFLRRTPWARAKVEDLYLMHLEGCFERCPSTFDTEK